MAHVMPLFGLGGALRREMGPGTTPLPHAIYVDLARWEKIPFLYAPETRRMVAQMVALAVEPDKLGRLQTVLEEELGHDVAFAVEAGKIAANTPGGTASIVLNMVEPRLSAPIDAASLDAALQPFAERLREAASETLAARGWARATSTR